VHWPNVDWNDTTNQVMIVLGVLSIFLAWFIIRRSKD